MITVKTNNPFSSVETVNLFCITNQAAENEVPIGK